jgi:hypothetical chaperone protein
MNQTAIGLDFGTTNSSIARIHANGGVELAQFPHKAGVTESFRSLLYLEKCQSGPRHELHAWSGPAAIDHYLAAETRGRLIQSLKSFLTSRTLHSTDVFGKQYTLENLIARILREIREQAERQFDIEFTSVVVGRPVRFVGAQTDDDDRYAVGRLQHALKQAGFHRIEFELEPIGAAYHYESTLTRDELILIGDFGGGTSDFSLLRVGPDVKKRGRSDQDLLGNAGLGLAGDTFDAKIIRHLVSPALGAGSEMRSVNKVLPVPTWVYSKLERWHHVSLLRSRETVNMLESVRVQAFEPHKIEALLHLIYEDLGYKLHQSVQRLKIQLSQSLSGRFQFQDGDVEIDQEVSRSEFEGWIEDELHSIEECVDGLLNNVGVNPKEVDRVFLTGGTSFVPAVRAIFDKRFGSPRIRSGDEFTSVARGLALRAFEKR